MYDSDEWVVSSLSLAVFAFAVVETNERERVMTSATPFAFLFTTVNFCSM